MLSSLALSLRIELTSPTDYKCVYKDCTASLRRFLKLSLHHSIVNITRSFTLISDYNLCTYIASNQELILIKIIFLKYSFINLISLTIIVHFFTIRTARSMLKLSCAVIALIPVTLFALIATPKPVPQMRSARSAFPAVINLAASTAK